MWYHIFDGKSIAPSNGGLPAATATAVGLWTKSGFFLKLLLNCLLDSFDSCGRTSARSSLTDFFYLAPTVYRQMKREGSSAKFKFKFSDPIEIP